MFECLRCHLHLSYIFKSVEIYALTCHNDTLITLEFCIVFQCLKRGYLSLKGKKERTSSARCLALKTCCQDMGLVS